MESPKKFEPADEIGEVDPKVIGDIVARFCPSCSPSEIVRLVLEVLARKSLGEAD
jgi:hypothetical protein